MQSNLPYHLVSEKKSGKLDGFIYHCRELLAMLFQFQKPEYSVEVGIHDSHR